MTENETLLRNVEVEFAQLMMETGQDGDPTKTKAANQA